jgi:uncharacterized protein
MDNDWWLYILLFLVASLYAGVGHGGASGYLAVMTLGGLDVLLIKTSALGLNVVISAIAFLFFTRFRHFRFSLFWPFALSSVPAAYLGGMLQPDPTWYRLILGIFLSVAALRFLLPVKNESEQTRPISFLPAICIGSGIGFLSGLIGIGGGIILSPIMLLLKWGQVKQVAAVSALFILVNSIAGILASSGRFQVSFYDVFPYLMAAVPGGVLGAWYGSRYSSPALLNKILALVLMVAALKLIFL